jgi:hypothetical protein
MKKIKIYKPNPKQLAKGDKLAPWSKKKETKLRQEIRNLLK